MHSKTINFKRTLYSYWRVWCSLQFAAGDARKALNLLDLIASIFEPEVENTINNAVVVKVAQQNIARYDKSGEQHYDLVSAFIKSIRGSDPDAALYWMARMLKGGEDPVLLQDVCWLPLQKTLETRIQMHYCLQVNVSVLYRRWECLRLELFWAKQQFI